MKDCACSALPSPSDNAPPDPGRRGCACSALDPSSPLAIPREFCSDRPPSDPTGARDRRRHKTPLCAGRGQTWPGSPRTTRRTRSNRPRACRLDTRHIAQRHTRDRGRRVQSPDLRADGSAGSCAWRRTRDALSAFRRPQRGLNARGASAQAVRAASRVNIRMLGMAYTGSEAGAGLVWRQYDVCKTFAASLKTALESQLEPFSPTLCRLLSAAVAFAAAVRRRGLRRFAWLPSHDAVARDEASTMAVRRPERQCQRSGTYPSAAAPTSDQKRQRLTPCASLKPTPNAVLTVKRWRCHGRDSPARPTLASGH